MQGEVSEQSVEYARKAVAALDADQQLRLASMFVGPKEWAKEKRRWES